MAKMIKCATCGADIASNAKSCPNCGAKNKKPVYKKPWLIILVFLIAVFAFNSLRYTIPGYGTMTITRSNASSEITDTMETKEEIIKTTSKSILKEYEKNSINAEDIYLGAYATVKMKISSIGEDNVCDYKGKIWADFADMNRSMLKSVSQKDGITVRGTITDIIGGSWVVLSDCIIVEAES